MYSQILTKPLLHQYFVCSTTTSRIQTPKITVHFIKCWNYSVCAGPNYLIYFMIFFVLLSEMGFSTDFALKLHQLRQTLVGKDHRRDAFYQRYHLLGQQRLLHPDLLASLAPLPLRYPPFFLLKYFCTSLIQWKWVENGKYIVVTTQSELNKQSKQNCHSFSQRPAFI